MKTRNGFVSNSSSSSFVIPLDALSPRQIRQIHDHIEYAKKLMSVGLFKDNEYWNDCDKWSITEDLDYLRGYTVMNNFPMYDFLDSIGVRSHDISWGED